VCIGKGKALTIYYCIRVDEQKMDSRLIFHDWNLIHISVNKIAIKR